MNIENSDFEEALKKASFWCNAWESGELSDEVLADKVSDLLNDDEGARGFFVISLTSESPLMDRLPEPLVNKLQEGGEFIIDLVVKNLAMSSAMTLFHKRQKNYDLKNSSERIKRRCIEILRLLDSHLVKERLEILLNGIKGFGKDNGLIKRWNYDKEQITAISESIFLVPEK